MLNPFTALAGFAQKALVYGSLAAALLATAAAGVQTVRLASIKVDLAHEKAGRATDVANAATQFRLESEANRMKEQRIADAQRKNADEQAHELAQARADATAAADVSRRLRARVTALAAAPGPPGADPAPREPGATTAGPGLVLAKLFGGADDTAGELADAFDAARAAGLRCQRDYDALDQ